MNKYEAVYFFQLKRGENTLDQVTPESLRGDAEVVLAAVQWGKGLSENLAHATPELRDDSDFALALAKVDSEGRALAYLSERLRDDRDVVMAFVSAWQAGTNLAFASERLKADEVIVRTALRSRGDSLAFVPQSRRGDPELLEIAYASRASALAHLPVAMLQDREFVLDFVTEHRAKEGLLQHLPAQYAQDREVLMQILAHDAASLQFACEGLRDDPEIVLHAMFKPMLNEVPAMGFEFAGAVLRKDKSFLTKVLERLKGYRPDYRKRVTTAIKDAHKLALAAANAVLERIAREGPELQASLTRSTAAMVLRLLTASRCSEASIRWYPA